VAALFSQIQANFFIEAGTQLAFYDGRVSLFAALISQIQANFFIKAGTQLNFHDCCVAFYCTGLCGCVGCFSLRSRPTSLSKQVCSWISMIVVLLFAARVSVTAHSSSIHILQSAMFHVHWLNHLHVFLKSCSLSCLHPYIQIELSPEQITQLTIVNALRPS
jgi:hypothetical protein